MAGSAEDDYKVQIEKLAKEKERIDTAYRAAVAKEFLAATKVEVFITSFDDFEDAELPDKAEDEEERIRIAPYNSTTAILKRKELSEAERKELLAAFSKQLAVPEHSGGALCHFPIHGLRIYSGETLLYSGTFCWACGNFSFVFPDGTSGWLDVNDELAALFFKLLPVPDEERKRFEAKYPVKK